MSLPPGEPPTDARPAPAAPGRRDILAVAGLTAHRALRFNYDGSPHAQLARFGKGLALPGVRIDALVAEAGRRGLLGAIGDAYAPIAGALLRYGAEIDDELGAWLPAAGWTPVEAVERAVLRSMIENEHAASLMGTAAVYQASSDEAALRVRRAGGVEDRRGGPRRVDPAALRRTGRRRRPRDAELRRHARPRRRISRSSRRSRSGASSPGWNRVLTFRITPASVGAGLSSGLAPASLVGALDCVGRHPLPSNVRAMIDDWIAHHRTASIARAWVVRVPESVADAVATGDLAKSVLDRPAPGVLAIDASVRRGELVKLLAKHRVSLGPPLSIEEALAHRDEEKFGPEGSWQARHAARREQAAKAPSRPLLLPLLFEGDPLLAERVASARAAGFPAPPQPPVPVSAPRPPNSPPTAVPPAKSPPAAPAAAAPDPPEPRSALIVAALLGDARAARLSDELVAAVVSLGAMYVEELPELERWGARLPPEARVALRDTFEAPLALADFLVLAPKARQTVLGKAHDLERLLRESSRSRDLGRVSPRGAAAIPLVAQAARILAAQRAAPSAPAETRSTSRGERAAPRPADFTRQSAEEVLATLREACAGSAPVHLLVRSGDRVAVHEVTPSAIQPRGASSALLAIDPDTDEGRVFHVPDVLAVLRSPSPSPRVASKS